MIDHLGLTLEKQALLTELYLHNIVPPLASRPATSSLVPRSQRHRFHAAWFIGVMLKGYMRSALTRQFVISSRNAGDTERST